MNQENKIFQPSELFEFLNCKDTETGHKILAGTLSLLMYLKPGESLETSFGTFSKLTPDLLHIQTNVHTDVLVDELVRSKVIKLPI